jgi:hypothetical protein
VNANIFFVQSTDGGATWPLASTPLRVNSDGTTTEQWQPAITVKPDGTKLFIAWYDRREDTVNNSLIRPYGVFADLPITGATSFSSKTEFRISTVSFPPAFTGTTMTSLGQYDPAYGPIVDFKDSRCCTVFGGLQAPYMGDYDLAFSDINFVYYTWADNRTTCTYHAQTRNQADVRLAKLAWPR